MIGDTRVQQAAKGALILLLVLAGLWTLHRYIDALVWATILAIALWPLFPRAHERWPPERYNVLLPGVSTGSVALVFMVPLALVGLEVASELANVLDTIQQALDQGIPAPSWFNDLPFGADQPSNWWQTHLGTPESAD